MKVRFLTWYFILCAHALMGSGLKGLSTSEYDGLNISKRIMQVQESHDGIKGNTGLYGGGDTGGFRGKHEIFHSMKAHSRGKGGGGASNIAHKTPGHRSAAPLSARPSFLVSTSLLYVSLALILVFPILLPKVF